MFPKLKDDLVQFVTKFKQHLFWMMLAVGLVLEVISLFDLFGTGTAGKLVDDLAHAVLVGGCFAVVLKSMQFMGIIRSELTDIVYGEEFLKRWKGTRTVWGRVSSIVFREMFPEIHGEIETAIFDHYFPKADGDCYLDQYKHSLVLRYVDPDTVELTELVRYVIRTNNDSMTIPCQYYSDDDVDSMQVVMLKVNGQDRLGDVSVSPGNPRHHFYSFELAGAREYEVHRKSVRTMKKSSSAGPQRVVRFNRFVHNAEIDIHHDPKFNVYLGENGTIGRFESLPNCAANEVRKRFTGILFPQQGFRIIWREV